MALNHFGTDGIRGKSEIFTDGYLQKIAEAIFFNAKKKVFVIGRDARVSGVSIAQIVIKLLVNMGSKVYYAGVTPTPVIAFLTVKYGAEYGIMVSASHNPPEYNGIKLFNCRGEKISIEEEEQIERAIDSEESLQFERGVGRVFAIDGDSAYLQYICSNFAPYFGGKRIFLDTANGATARLAPAVFKALGATVVVANDDVSGEKINVNCGATHIECALEASYNYDIAFSFDGDGDRLFACKKGKVFNGDHIMYIAAKYFKEKGALPNDIVVTTVMSNFGLEIALNKLGISLVRANVGDRNVSVKMKELSAIIGGEASGHLIFCDYQTTGDGILSAVMFAKIDSECGCNYDDMQQYPQCEGDIVTNKDGIMRFVNNSAIMNEIEKISKRIDGRIVVRPSGTEPKIRIMAEAETLKSAKQYVKRIQRLIEQAIGC